MSFPETRFTLIQRLARGGEERDWQAFLSDYWGPVCRFARSRGRLSAEDAEDVAARTLEAILRNRLLPRWAAMPTARLRTLICAVVRNVLSNQYRIESGRARIVREHAGRLDRYLETVEAETGVAAETPGGFYAAWADDLLQEAVEGLLGDYERSGQGDRFRVLYGRLSEQLSIPQIAAALKLKVGTAEYFYRVSRQRLADKLREALRARVRRCVLSAERDAEFDAEWQRLGDYCQTQGGLEAAVRRSCQDYDPAHRSRWRARVAQPTAAERAPEHASRDCRP